MTFAVQGRSVDFTLADNGGRRSGIERRRFSYAEHIPERRSGRDRRCGKDRRCKGEGKGRDEQQIGWMEDGAESRRSTDRRTSLLG